MQTARKYACVLVALLSVATTLGDEVVNGGFEQAYLDLPGWESNVTRDLGNALAVPRSAPLGNRREAWEPTEGNQFALLINGLYRHGGPIGIFIRQTITLDPGEFLAFDFFFNTSDSLPYDDRLYFSLSGTPPLFWGYSVGVAEVGNRGSTDGWITLYTAANNHHLPHEYTFSATLWESSNPVHFNYPSFAGIDNIHIVPEPASLALLTLGALASLKSRRR